jgi:hypothetical protein
MYSPLARGFGQVPMTATRIGDRIDKEVTINSTTTATEYLCLGHPSPKHAIQPRGLDAFANWPAFGGSILSLIAVKGTAPGDGLKRKQRRPTDLPEARSFGKMPRSTLQGWDGESGRQSPCPTLPIERLQLFLLVVLPGIIATRNWPNSRFGFRLNPQRQQRDHA